jgi:bifunctional UDP-N-acetylglucosamine pyrophosphorylase/glucosamine-1-phosphate N-acetyltransferase
LIAPLKIDSNATVGAGSTITQDIFKDTLTISRAKQVTVEKWKRFKLPKDSEK